MVTSIAQRLFSSLLSIQRLKQWLHKFRIVFFSFMPPLFAIGCGRNGNTATRFYASTRIFDPKKKKCPIFTVRFFFCILSYFSGVIMHKKTDESNFISGCYFQNVLYIYASLFFCFLSCCYNQWLLPAEPVPFKESAINQDKSVVEFYCFSLMPSQLRVFLSCQKQKSRYFIVLMSFFYCCCGGELALTDVVCLTVSAGLKSLVSRVSLSFG